MTTEVWMLERWNSDDYNTYSLNEGHGVFLYRELAEAKIVELNATERIRAEEVAERAFQAQHAAWSRQRAEHAILHAAGARQGSFTLAEPKRYTLTRTVDEYRLSDPLDLHTRENVI